MTSHSINTAKLAELAEKFRAARLAAQTPVQSASQQLIPPVKPEETIITIPSAPPKEDLAAATTDRYGNTITYNTKQAEFIRIAGIEGKSAVLIGAAGTGKTTCQKGVTQALIQSGRAGILQSNGHKHLPAGEVPGIVICAYTRRAVANIRKNLPIDLQGNAITIHKLLEYQPVYYEVWDETSGEMRNTMKFEATRNAGNPLPSSIHTIIYEETSMLGTDLYKEVVNACPHKPQEIFLGDIQQLPPVFGPAILGFKLLELPVVELTEVYRQALESPIISLAHRILSGNSIQQTALTEWQKPGQMTIRPWKKQIDWHDALNTAGLVFVGADKTPGLLQAGMYNPEEDIILIPYNVNFGTDELNKIIANKIARTRGATTYQIIAGFNKLYLSVGDKVLYDKEDAVVIDIEPNPIYSGAQPVSASPTLDYWGFDPNYHLAQSSDDTDVDFLLSQVAAAELSEDRVKKGSHIVTLKMLDSEQEVKVESAGDLNSLLLGYCLTVHKSQGSEFRRVFLCLHQSHNKMISRELLYTAVTRAREELYVICEPDHFIKGINSQRVKGNSLEEKAEYFKGKLSKDFTLEG